MPRVGDKQFTYDEAGLKAAEIEADKTGAPIIRDTGIEVEQAQDSQEPALAGPAPVPETAEIPSYDAGGRVQRIMGYGDGGKVGTHKSRGKFIGLSESEKATIEKVGKEVKKVAKKVADITVSSAKKAYKTAKPIAKKVAKKAKSAKDYTTFATGTALGKSERAAKRNVKKAVKTAGGYWESLKDYEKKSRVKKKKPKFNMKTKKWE